ncbi:MAG: tetratricopeptide repeat protein [bacterium]|jgi:Flp pilus assembly protein TadD|nr:tetratricopeptide repeat protein [bacterium]
MSHFFFSGFAILGICCAFLLAGAGCASSPYENFNRGVEQGQDADSATKAYGRALENDPHDAEAWNQMGILAFEQSEWEKAEACFREAHQLDRLHPAYPRNLAMVTAATQNLTEAENWIELALSLAPADIDSLLTQAKIKILQNDPNPAREILQQVLQKEPGQEEALRLLAILPSLSSTQ